MMPKHEEKDDISSLFSTLERVMTRKEIKEDGWLNCLISCMVSTVRKDLEDVITSDDCSFSMVVETQLARGSMDPRAAQMRFFSEMVLPAKMRASAAISGVPTVPEAIAVLTRCKTKSLMVPSLQELIDSRTLEDHNKFLACVTEW